MRRYLQILVALALLLGLIPGRAVADSFGVWAFYNYYGNPDNTFFQIGGTSEYDLSHITVTGTGYGGSINGQSGSVTFGNVLSPGQALQFTFQPASSYNFGTGNMAVFDQDFSATHTGNVLYTVSALLNGQTVSGPFSPDVNLTGGFVPFLGNDASGQAIVPEPQYVFAHVAEITAGVPEPSSLALMGMVTLGVGGVLYVRRRRGAKA